MVPRFVYSLCMSNVYYLEVLDKKVRRRSVVVRVSRVSVGVNCEGPESVVYMGGDKDTSDDCLLGQEKLYMSSRGTRGEHILQSQALQEIIYKSTIIRRICTYIDL